MAINQQNVSSAFYRVHWLALIAAFMNLTWLTGCVTEDFTIGGRVGFALLEKCMSECDCCGYAGKNLKEYRKALKIAAGERMAKLEAEIARLQEKVTDLSDEAYEYSDHAEGLLRENLALTKILDEGQSLARRLHSDLATWAGRANKLMHDQTKQVSDMVRVRWWVQDTQESGHWEVTGLVGLKTARMYVKSGVYDRAEIVKDEDGWPLYEGDWSGDGNALQPQKL